MSDIDDQIADKEAQLEALMVQEDNEPPASPISPISPSAPPPSQPSPANPLTPNVQPPTGPAIPYGPPPMPPVEPKSDDGSAPWYRNPLLWSSATAAGTNLKSVQDFAAGRGALLNQLPGQPFTGKPEEVLENLIKQKMDAPVPTGGIPLTRRAAFNASVRDILGTLSDKKGELTTLDGKMPVDPATGKKTKVSSGEKVPLDRGGKFANKVTSEIVSADNIADIKKTYPVDEQALIGKKVWISTNKQGNRTMLLTDADSGPPKEGSKVYTPKQGTNQLEKVKLGPSTFQAGANFEANRIPLKASQIPDYTDITAKEITAWREKNRKALLTRAGQVIKNPSIVKGEQWKNFRKGLGIRVGVPLAVGGGFMAFDAFFGDDTTPEEKAEIQNYQATDRMLAALERQALQFQQEDQHNEIRALIDSGTLSPEDEKRAREALPLEPNPLMPVRL